MNLAQWFMLIQIITCIGGFVGFLATKQPWAGIVWLCYGAANVGWFMIASGSK